MRRLGVPLLLLLAGIAAAEVAARPVSIHPQGGGPAANHLREFGERAKSARQSSGLGRGDLDARRREVPERGQPRRAIEITNNATMCAMFWEDLSAAMAQMSAGPCGLGSREVLLSGHNASFFCEMDLEANSTGAKCGTDSFLALTRPIYFKYRGTVDDHCSTPPDLQIGSATDLLRSFAFANVQCLADADGNYCLPMQMIPDSSVNGTQDPILSLLASYGVGSWPSAHTLDAQCSGCPSIGTTGLKAIADELLGGLEPVTTMDVLSFAFDTVHAPCSAKFVLGQYCSEFLNGAPSAAGSDCNDSIFECADELKAGMPPMCDNPCMKINLTQAAVVEPGKDDLLPSRCSLAANGDSCFVSYMRAMSEVGVVPNKPPPKEPPLPIDVLRSQCGAEMAGAAGTCSTQCSDALYTINSKLECCFDPLLNTFTASQKLEVFHASNLCGVQLMPACKGEYHAVEFTVTLNHIDPAWIASNEIDVGVLVTDDLAQMMGVDPMMLGTVGFTAGTSTYRMTALFADGFGDDADASSRASAFKTRLEGHTTFKLPSLSNKVPGHAVLGGAMQIVFDCTVSEIADPAEREDEHTSVMAMIRIDGLTKAAFEGNSNMMMNKFRLALANLAMIPPTKVSVSDSADDSGGLVVNVTAVAPNLAHVYRIQGALSHKMLVDAALMVEGVANTSMVAAAMVGPAPSMPLKLLDRCELRPVDMELNGQVLSLAVVHCFTDEDLYLKSNQDATLPPLPSHFNKTQMAEALKGSSIPPQQQNSRNWASVSREQSPDDPDSPPTIVPNYVREWAGNLKISCGTTEMKQIRDHSPPASSMYTGAPVSNPLGELWQTFGASKFFQERMPNTIAFSFMIEPYITDPEWPNPLMGRDVVETCMREGMLKVKFDQRGDPQEPRSWFFTDKDGNQPYHFAEVEVRPRQLSCNVEEFQVVSRSRIQQLARLLRGSPSQRTLQSAMMTLSTIQSDEGWAGCQQRLDELYSTSTAQATISGIRACVDPSNTNDPCCNDALRWSQCCVPSTKTFNISGAFGSVNEAAVGKSCGDNAALVTALLEEEFSDVLLARQVPEFGCDSRADGVFEARFWNNLMEPLWNCVVHVASGASTSGTGTCSDPSDCWTQSCVDPGYGTSKRCAAAFGEAAFEPVFRCAATRADPSLWERMAIMMDVDPARINKDMPMQGSEWEEAVGKFRDQTSVASCAGTSPQMWCVIDVPEATCKMYSSDSSSMLQWVPDPTGGGYCKMRTFHIDENLDDEAALQHCTQEFQNPGFVCDKGPYFSQQACVDAGGTPLNTTDKAVSVHRLQTTGRFEFDDNGSPYTTLLMGNETLCTMQKACNWDRDGSITEGDSAKCLTAENIVRHSTNVTLPSAKFAHSSDPSKKMACLQCWGPWCTPFSAATSAFCSAGEFSPWTLSAADCASQTGGGPDGLPAASFAALLWGGWHQERMCHRDSLDSINTCLDTRVCPTPARYGWQHKSDAWTRNCNRPMCIHPSATEAECTPEHLVGAPLNLTWVQSTWHSEWKQGSGLCSIDWAHGQSGPIRTRTKTGCEAIGGGVFWWEGRSFRPAAFNTADTCDSFCDNGEWPPPSECSEDTSRCDMTCPQCLPQDRDNFLAGVCVYEGATDAQCNASSYDWHGSSGVCTLRNFETGSKSACEAMPMHSFHTCVGVAEESCMAYCWAKDFVDQDSCGSDNSGREWDGDLQRCRWPSWHVSQDTVMCSDAQSEVACTSIGTMVNGDWSQKCAWDYVNSNCSGSGAGCSAMPGNNEWVGPSGKDGSVISSVLQCRVEQYATCGDKQSCEAAGWCSDWEAEQGICIVPREQTVDGYAKDCSEIAKGETNDEGYEEALMGAFCIVKKARNGVNQRVVKGECSNVTYPGARWVERAQTKAECDAYGSVCRGSGSHWDIRGGMNESVCEPVCDLEMTKVSTFQSGTWATSRERPLKWVERSYESLNMWESHSLSWASYMHFVVGAIANIAASQLESQILCELDALTGWVPLFGSLCGAEGTSASPSDEVAYSLDKNTLACGKLDTAKPQITFQGSYIPGAGSSCAAGGASVEVSLKKRVRIGANERRLLLASNRRDLADCTAHRVVLNANGATVGQKVGPGLTVDGLNNVVLCVNPTVTQRCSEYTVPDFVELDDALMYGKPLEVTVTTNAQGHYCFSGANSGKTYVPVHLDPNWKTMGSSVGPTPTPAPAPTPAPTPAPGTTTPAPTVVVFEPGSEPVTLSGLTDVSLPGGATTLQVDPGSEGVTASVINATAGQEAVVQMALPSGTTVNLPLSAMGANQKVQLRAVNASSVAAASPLPSGSTAASEALSIALTPPLQVNLSFSLVRMVGGRRQGSVHHVHWLDKLANEWRPLCSDHTKDAAGSSVSAPVSKEVQEEEGFNPSSGCASGVTPCDGSGGTLLVFGLDAEPDCSGGGGLSIGAIVGIAIGGAAGLGLIAGGAFFAWKHFMEEDDRSALYQSTSPSLAAALGEEPKRPGEPEAAV